ncbi:hypothetical protein EV121DRAFT_295222 [Schizophyllum commune]
MVLQGLADFVGFRRLRSGHIFSEYYTVPNPDFDLDALGLAAAENEQDDPQPTENGEGEDDAYDGEWEDLEDDSPLSSLPSSPARSRPASPSPLSSLTPSPEQSRPPSPDKAPAGASFAIKGSGRKRRRKAHGREMRAKRRKADPYGQPERKKPQARYVKQSQPHRVDFNLKKARVAKTGFRGLFEEECTQTHTLQQLLKVGFKYYPFQGRETTPIVAPLAAEPDPDAPPGTPPPPPEDVVVGVLAGPPKDGERSGRGDQPTFEDAHKTLASAIEEQRTLNKFAKDACVHRRGRFGAQAEGISHGGGQLKPARLKHSPAMSLALFYLISLPAMLRIAHHGSTLFANWAPAIHEYYATTLAALLSNDPSLFVNFPRSVWCCITINFGPKTVTYPHRDYGNLPFGWCAITALGNYDPDVGGHLVLWDCKMVIRFPPGSTILIPSAIIKHSNTRVGKHERRYSVTQYTAGAIFRWVEHGCQLDEKYYASLSKEEKAADRKTAAGRWKRGRAMFSKLRDILAGTEEAT